jgi:hypothetical protein
MFNFKVGFLWPSALASFLLLQAGQAQDMAVIGSLKYYVSIKKSDHFVGYFTPFDPKTGHNFQACSSDGVKGRFVKDDEVERAVWAKCAPRVGPNTLLTASDFLKQSIGGPVFNQSGEFVGSVKGVLANNKGGIAAYVVQEESDAGGSFGLLGASKVSAWSGYAGVSFLSDGIPIKMPGINSTEGNWLNADAKAAVEAIIAQGDIQEFGVAIESGQTVFGKVLVYSKEDWLSVSAP